MKMKRTTTKRKIINSMINSVRVNSLFYMYVYMYRGTHISMIHMCERFAYIYADITYVCILVIERERLCNREKERA